jgi:hypothetical protein
LALPWEERFRFVKHQAFRHLIPDYGFLLQHAQGLLPCFVEVVSGEESPVRMRQKLHAYTNWAGGSPAREFLAGLYRQDGIRESRTQFRLLLVAHDRRAGNDHTRLRQLLQEALSLPRTMRLRIWATTVADLAAADTLDVPIWIRARDLQPATAGSGYVSRQEHRRFLDFLLRSVPRHKLFPRPESSTHIPSSRLHPDAMPQLPTE